GAVTELAAVAESHVDAPSEVLAEREYSSAPYGQETPSVFLMSEPAEGGPGQDIAPSPIQGNETGPSTELAVQPLPTEAAEEAIAQEAPEAGPIAAAHD